MRDYHNILDAAQSFESAWGFIFDMDGLVFDTEKIFQQTWNEIAEERGIHLPKDFVRAISGFPGSSL